MLTRFALVFHLACLSPTVSIAQEPDGAAPSARRFEFRDGPSFAFQVSTSDPDKVSAMADSPKAWIEAWPENGTVPVRLGPRIVLRPLRTAALEKLIHGRPVRLVRSLTEGVFVLEASDTWTALEQAAELAQAPDVLTSVPVIRRPAQLHGRYLPPPNDPYFSRPDRPATDWQAHLENRGTNGEALGIDLNTRAAWPSSRGQGVVIAVVDNGIDLDHPDLTARSAGGLHLNFNTLALNGWPAGRNSNHGTAVAGLAAATLNNQTGIAGVAPESSLASWVVFNSFDGMDLSDEELMNMFQYRSNSVAIQNHSWGKIGDEQVRLSTLENLGIENAVRHGRDGRGVVIVRSAGNDRNSLYNANDDGYLADPRVIAVGAIRLDGRAARYTNLGACILVAAPSGDFDPEFNPCVTNSPSLFTTDRQGSLGYNAAGAGDLADYAFGDNGFSGTSAAAPQISGIVALILGANPDLTYRDVQQILIQSARHHFTDDPNTQVNGAGFRVNHDSGFGVPDAGLAVGLAQIWPNRPPVERITLATAQPALIPDQGLRLEIDGPTIPTELRSIIARPSDGLHADSPTALLPLRAVGQLSQPAVDDLTGQAALIERGVSFFCEKVDRAAQAGAGFAVVYNNIDTEDILLMGGLDYGQIPAVFISRKDGLALESLIRSGADVRARLTLATVDFQFEVQESLLCEHVGVRVDTTHSRRSDVRITLVSPSGTRSILQQLNDDPSRGPIDWTYFSVHHFYEAGAGTWTVSISDEAAGGTGSVKSVSLILNGVRITDSDADGLDDAWELAHWNSLEFGPSDDPDADGFSNSREQILGTDPRTPDLPFEIDLSPWNPELARLSWPGSTNFTYQIRTGTSPVSLQNLITNIPGRFPETEWFTPLVDRPIEFFRIEAKPISKAILNDPAAESPSAPVSLP